jgi:hypothetical protein
VRQEIDTLELADRISANLMPGIRLALNERLEPVEKRLEDLEQSRDAMRKGWKTLFGFVGFVGTLVAAWRKSKTAAVLLWLTAILAGVVLIAGAASGQATRPVEQAAQLRDLADYVEAVTRSNREYADQVARLQVEIAQLSEGYVPVWGTEPPEAGKTYRVPPGPVSITLTTPGVTLLGVLGVVYPTDTFGIHVRADDCTVDRFAFDKPDAAPIGRLGVKPCIRLAAKRPTVTRCTTANVDTFVEAMPGTEDGLITRCNAGPGLRAGFVYAAGAKRLTISYCNVPNGSEGENVIRFSPELNQVSENVAVLHCNLYRWGNKHTIDARHVRGVTIEHCTLTNGARGESGEILPAVRLGDDSAPGCTGLVMRDNTITGQVHAKGVSEGVFTGNRFVGLNPATDVAINRNAASLVKPTNNVAFYAGPAPARMKPMDTGGEPSNRWELLPTTQPIQ